MAFTSSLAQTREPRSRSTWDLDEASNKTIVSSAGYSHSNGHHGEFIQGQFLHLNRLMRGLLTVPCERFYSRARFEIDRNSKTVSVFPASNAKSLAAALLTLKECGAENCGGRLYITNNIRRGWGLGSSTADVTASIEAVAAIFGIKLRPEVIAELAIAAETASDSIMFRNRAVIFAQRDAIIIEDLAGSLPNVLVLGFNTDPAGVDTLAYPPANYSASQVSEFEALRALLRRAVHSQSASLLGAVSTSSALINQEFLPKPKFKQTLRLMEDVGGVGLQVAHSGTIIGLMFDPADVEAAARMQVAAEKIAEMGFGDSWNFEVCHKRREDSVNDSPKL